MIIADENIDSTIIAVLRKKYKVVSVAEEYKGFGDEDVIEIVKTYEGILLTEDKDFEEWVFAHGKKGFSVIFLRYEKKETEAIIKTLLNVIKKLNFAEHSFITISRNKIRARKI